jgi:hypothetical protein
MFHTERTSVSFTRLMSVVCLALVFAAQGPAAAQSRFSGIVVFGTSLSDPGNAFVLVGDANTPPDFMLSPLLIPSAPYARGGHHFSNGATWVEQYARSVGLGDSVKGGVGDDRPGGHQLRGGRRQAYDDGINVNLTRQVDTFLERSGSECDRCGSRGVRPDQRDERVCDAQYRAVHLRACRCVPVLGRHPSHQGRARDTRAGDFKRVAIDPRATCALF